MYKLLIVDDEMLERQALRYFIEHSKLEVSEIIECVNGIDAVKMALTEQPQICILDIKMPGLNGLEAMNQILAVNKRCKILFSSAYNYFDYALRALQMGALDFLTKPVKKETLIRALNKAIDQLDAENNVKIYNSKMTDITYVLEKRILRELISGQTDEETLWFLDIMEMGGDSSGSIIFVRFLREITESEQINLSKMLRGDLTAAGYQHLLYAHRKSVDFLVTSKFPERQEEIISHVKDIFLSVLDAMGIPYKLGIGSWISDLLQIEFSYIEAKEQIGELVSPEEARIAENLDRAIEEKGGIKVSVPSEIEAVCQYINQNYSAKITLDSIAIAVGFSKYYISRLFKQYTGKTIIDYLIQVRLNEAKILLEHGEYSIKQISFMIGYTDPNYFTWSFKKYLGMSPIKYRYFQNSGV